MMVVPVEGGINDDISRYFATEANQFSELQASPTFHICTIQVLLNAIWLYSYEHYYKYGDEMSAAKRIDVGVIIAAVLSALWG